MTQLSASVIQWIREGFPDGVADHEAPALGAVLQERLGTEAAHDVLRRLVRVLVALGLVAAVAAACEGGAAPATPLPVAGSSDAPREVNIIAKDRSFLPDVVDFIPGETVLLHVINGGLEVHEAVIGDATVQDAWEAAEAATEAKSGCRQSNPRKRTDSSPANGCRTPRRWRGSVSCWNTPNREPAAVGAWVRPGCVVTRNKSTH